jgi:ribonuclease H / adenosylcobalamin/alpha-ribazole phosphatase
MTTTVLLARHGSHSEMGRILSGRSEIALNAKGRAEAEALADHLARIPLASIHSSPRRRTLETASAAAARKGLEVRIAHALDEIDFGRFSGCSFAELEGDVDWGQWNAERGTARCPGGESMAEATARAMTYFAELPEEQSPALCVTHCDVIRGAVAAVLDLGFERMFAFECGAGSVTTLQFEEGRARLLSLNERAWLV